MARTYGNFTDFIDFSRASSGTALRKVSYGPELVTNGTFDTDTSGWSVNVPADMSISVVGGELYGTKTGSSSVRWAYQSFETVVGQTYKFSGFVKRGTGNNCFLHVGTSTGNGSLFSGLTMSTSGETLSGTFVATTTTTYVSVLGHDGADGTTAYADNISVKEVTFDQADGTLELFNHPAGIPRIEYDANGNEIGLLIEEQRTNLVTYSNDFTNAAWNRTSLGTATNPVVTANYAVSPDGGLNASRIVFDASGGTSSDRSIIRFYETTAANRYGSIWIKSNTGSSQSLGLFSGSTLIPITATTEWVRVGSADFTSGLTWFGFEVRGDIEAAVDILVYGAQLEQGSFPTSYIPTSGAQATRSADIADIATANFGYNPKAGTIVVEFRSSGFDPQTSSTLDFSDGTVNNRWSVRAAYAQSWHTSNISNGVLDYNDVGTDFAEVAYAISSSGQSASLNGGSVLFDDVTGMPTGITTLYIGTRFDGLSYYLNGHIKSIKYRPRRNTNTQLQEFTS